MRKILALLMILGLVVAGTAWWTGRQGGRLPGWYLEARAAGRLEPDLEEAARRAQQSLLGRFGRELLDEVTADDGTPNESFFDRVKRRGKLVLDGLREGREVRLDAEDLEELILSMAYEQEGGRELLAAIKAVHAEISNGELELGVVVTPADLPAERLSDSQRELLEVILRFSGSDGEVYLAVRAVPRAVDDQLLLGPPISLSIGELTVSSSLLTALGVAAPELESGLVLDVGRARVREATIEDEVLVLVISPEL